MFNKQNESFNVRFSSCFYHFNISFYGEYWQKKVQYAEMTLFYSRISINYKSMLIFKRQTNKTRTHKCLIVHQGIDGNRK